jgi:hypothetical protein
MISNDRAADDCGSLKCRAGGGGRDMRGYDLLEVPDGYRTSMVLLVAPYFDPRFIKTLVKKLSPEKIRLVIDDGIRGEEIKQLIKAANGTADVKVALGVAAGLVHIKGYYAEFVKIDGRSRRRRRFFYGSANATDAAFHGRRNAELIASVDLSAGGERSAAKAAAAGYSLHCVRQPGPP